MRVRCLLHHFCHSQRAPYPRWGSHNNHLLHHFHFLSSLLSTGAMRPRKGGAGYTLPWLIITSIGIVFGILWMERYVKRPTPSMLLCINLPSVFAYLPRSCHLKWHNNVQKVFLRLLVFIFIHWDKMSPNPLF